MHQYSETHDDALSSQARPSDTDGIWTGDHFGAHLDESFQLTNQATFTAGQIQGLAQASGALSQGSYDSVSSQTRDASQSSLTQACINGVVDLEAAIYRRARGHGDYTRLLDGEHKRIVRYLNSKIQFYSPSRQNSSTGPIGGPFVRPRYASGQGQMVQRQQLPQRPQQGHPSIYAQPHQQPMHSLAANNLLGSPQYHMQNVHAQTQLPQGQLHSDDFHQQAHWHSIINPNQQPTSSPTTMFSFINSNPMQQQQTMIVSPGEVNMGQQHQQQLPGTGMNMVMWPQQQMAPSPSQTTPGFNQNQHLATYWGSERQYASSDYSPRMSVNLDASSALIGNTLNDEANTAAQSGGVVSNSLGDGVNTFLLEQPEQNMPQREQQQPTVAIGRVVDTDASTAMSPVQEVHVPDITATIKLIDQLKQAPTQESKKEVLMLIKVQNPRVFKKLIDAQNAKNQRQEGQSI